MPGIACLMLTSFDDEDALLDAIMAGAAGHVLKQIKGADLVSAVRTVATGQSMLDPAATARLMRSLRTPEAAGPPEDERLAALSERERSVLELIGEGFTNRQIAERLYLSEKTVKNHISRLLAKLGVERRVQAAVIAARVHEHEAGGGSPLTPGRTAAGRAIRVRCRPRRPAAREPTAPRPSARPARRGCAVRCGRCPGERRPRRRSP